MHSVDILLHNTHLRNFRLAELLPETAAREQLRWAVGIESPQYQGVFFFRTLYKALSMAHEAIFRRASLAQVLNRSERATLRLRIPRFVFRNDGPLANPLRASMHESRSPDSGLADVKWFFDMRDLAAYGLRW